MTTRTYPGMLDTSKEYFNSGRDVMMIHNGSVKRFEDVCSHPELQQIIESETDLQKVLNEWHPNDQLSQQKVVARCRFGALNFSPDFSGGQNVADHSDCPHRGSCIGENIVCKPVSVDGVQLTVEELTILRALTGDDKNTTIAGKLGYATGTFFVQKTRIYSKFNRLITKQQIARMLFLEGLL